MIHINQTPLSTPEESSLRALFQHPGYGLLIRFIDHQTSEHQAMSSNKMILTDELIPSDDALAEAKDLNTKAKVFAAASDMLEQMRRKEFKFYAIELKPEPKIKTPNQTP